MRKAPMVTVNVGLGSNRASFLLHKSLLQQKSEYFRAALSGNFVEGQNNVVNLPDDDPGAFSHFVDWIYAGWISTDHISTNPSELVLAWVLADKLLCHEFQNRIISRIRFLFSTSTPFALDYPFQLLVKLGLQDSKITSLLMKIYAWRFARSRNSKGTKNAAKTFFGNQYDSEFNLLYMDEVIKAREAQAVSPFEQDICQWHQHDSGFKGSCTKDSNKRRKTGSG